MKSKKNKTGKPPEWNASATAAENARDVLPNLAADFFAAGRKASMDGTSWKDLHAFRLAGKRFRYSLELFRPVFGQELEKKLKALKQLQDYLGDVNDCVTVQEMIESRSRREVHSKPAILEFLTARAEELTSEFRAHWTGVFDADGEEQRWMSFLAGAGQSSGNRGAKFKPKSPAAKRSTKRAAASKKTASRKRPT